MINKLQYEAQLRRIFKLLLEGKTQEEIARELDIGVRTVARYSQRIGKRYNEIQRQKTDNTIFLESQLFKNRLLNLYKIAEDKARNPAMNGSETAKCLEVAENLAIDVMKVEIEGVKAVKQGLVSIEAANKNNALTNFKSSNNNNKDEYSNHYDNDCDDIIKENFDDDERQC